MSEPKGFVPCKEIKKGRVYYLPGDFWPHGGLAVTLKRWDRAADTFPGMRGEAAIMVSDDGMVFFIHPKGVVATERGGNEQAPKADSVDS